jgi:uncharacterized protein with NRDE domain
MCTLVVLHRAVPGVPLLVAANRDEYLDRRAEGPALRQTPAGVSVLAPRDTRGGGTWLGLSARGVFAAVTNVAGAAPDPTRRSRGLLVLDALEAPSARAAAEHAEAAAPRSYNPFNLFVSDGREAWCVSSRGERARRVRLEPGAHVVGNGALDVEPTPKVARLQARAERLEGRPLPDALDGLAELCRGHCDGDPLGSACVHTERYGTRCSTLFALGERPDAGLFRFADGAPCETAYGDFTPLLRELVRGFQPAEGESVARMVS